MKYDLEIQSRYLYCSNDRIKFGELFDFTGFCDWADDTESDNDFDVELRSDKLRWKTEIEVNANQTYMGDLSSSNRIKVRHNFQLFARVGFYGLYFHYTVTKKIPSTGVFSWTGSQLSVLPLNVDQEFYATLDTITVGW